MTTNIGLEGPEELEQLAFKRINDGKLKEGLKLVLRAAKGYEEEGKKEDAARLYKYLGYVLLEKTKLIEKARPSLLKSAYLYIDLIEEEITRPEVNLDILDEYCSNVLEIFLTLNDERNLMKYAEEFAAIYEDLGNSYRDNNDIPIAIRAYESAYRYYKIIDNIESYKKIAEILITLYGQIAEEKLEKGDLKGAAEAFYRLASFIRSIFGYDIHFIEMMDTAAKNFEKASKVAYSNGDLDRTTNCLVKAQYAYLLAKNFNRAKLIGINTVRMLYQIISSHRANGNYDMAAEKLVEMAEALIGIGKIKEAMEAYKSALETRSDLKFRVRVRLAILKQFVASKGDEDLLEDIDTIEYYTNKKNYLKALELAEKVLLKRDELKEVTNILHEAEGIYR
ncbi:hypothetical protein E3E26_08210 [Thermococcus sp. LS1]|uniref:hypothetical protein n=1 Tax=Thermococcus sp. LS1 TaxID=1638259 RepID=UPI00143A3A9A|nr:hypothetical protein [Thermococcus sp. LS1]NJD99762.1 hypothetical protein [Thermococcus sp. LS1]